MSNKLTPPALHLLGFKQDFQVAITFCTYLEKGIQEIRPDTFDSLTKNKIPILQRLKGNYKQVDTGNEKRFARSTKVDLVVKHLNMVFSTVRRTVTTVLYVWLFQSRTKKITQVKVITYCSLKITVTSFYCTGVRIQ